MVREIECIHPEVEGAALVDREPFLQRRIEVRLPGRAQNIAVQLRGKRARRGCREVLHATRRRCKPVVVIRIAVGEVAIPFQHRTRTARSHSRDILRGRHRERCARLELVGLRQLPARQRLA